MKKTFSHIKPLDDFKINIAIKGKQQSPHGAAQIQKISLQELFSIIDEYYEGKKYLSKNELLALRNKIKSPLTDNAKLFLEDIEDCYDDRQYMTKKELMQIKKGYDDRL